MQLRILGPVEIEIAGAVVPVSRRRERCLLGVLLLELGRVVSAERLAELLWDGDPPETARRTIHSHVSRLRATLTAASQVELIRVGDGYRLSTDPQAVDAHRFQTLLDQAADSTDLALRISYIRSALDLWRGPVLDNAATEWVRFRLCAGLQEQRLAAIENLASACLDLRREGEILPELTGVAAAHPGRERLTELHMRALYQTGRKADALQVYARTRSYLADDLGLDPGPRLRELQQAILRDELVSPAAAAASQVAPEARHEAPATEPERLTSTRVTPQQLPPDLATFTGRVHQLKQLGALLPGADGSRPTAPVMVAIDGTAGVGKTTLALRWAHTVRDRFPDGQLYVNLRGFDPGGAPTEPIHVVHGFLDALEVPADRIPASTDAQVGLYRSLLADRRMLILLDNARDTEQVRPLLPGSPGSLVIVTSRSQLSGLIAAEGAHPLALDLLTYEEARHLLERRLGTDRVAAEPDATDEIITRCARLPLALAVVAARAAANPRFPLHVLAGELGEAAGRLDAWSDPGAITDVRTIFSWSLQALTTDAVGLFRLLGMHPGPDLSVPAAASLAGTSVPQAHKLLKELAYAHLVDEHTPGRYTFHDLLRAYATELADSAEHHHEGRLALRRVLDHYLHTAVGAIPALSPSRITITPPPAEQETTPERLTGREQALAWFTAEQEVLSSAVSTAARTGFETHSWQLAFAAAAYLDRRGRWREQLAMHHTALQAAQRINDPTGQAYAGCMLGQALTRLGRYDDAQAQLRQALGLFDRLGDHIGQATVHTNLGMVHAGQQLYQKTVDHTLRALELYRLSGHRSLEATALNNLSMAYGLLGDYRRSLAHGEQALALYQESGHHHGHAATLDSLGQAYHHLGHHQQAITCYRQALDVCRASDHPFSQAVILTHLGDTHHTASDADAARSAWQLALDILQQLDHPDAEGLRDKLDRLATAAAADRVTRPAT